MVTANQDTENPLIQIHNAFWTMLEAHEPFTQLIPEGNRIKYSGKVGMKDKDEISNADLPEVRVACVETSPHLQRTSNSSTLVKIFEVLISTGDWRINTLATLEWEILRALSKWSDSLSALTWRGARFVQLAKPTGMKRSVIEHGQNRGLQGWSAVWSCEVNLVFKTLDLQGV